MRQLLLPFGGAANEGAARTGATVSAAIAGDAATSDTDPTARPSRTLGRTKPFTDIPLPSRLDAQARASYSNVSPGPSDHNPPELGLSIANLSLLFATPKSGGHVGQRVDRP